MARQSELDDLRKEVEALRTGQGAMYPLGAEADAAFKDINAGLTGPTAAAALPAPEPEAPVMTPAADEWPDTPSPVEPVMTTKSKRSAPMAKTDTGTSGSATAKPRSATKPKTAAPAAKTKPVAAKPKTSRKKAVDL